MTDQAEIDEIDRKKGWVYACCAYPASNVVWMFKYLQYNRLLKEKHHVQII